MALAITQHNVEEITQATKPVIIDVFAPWCGPCQQMEPIIEELEKEMGDRYMFAKLNVDEARDLSIKYGVSSVPTFVFIKDGMVKGKEVGFMSKETLKEKIEQYLK